MPATRRLASPDSSARRFFTRGSETAAACSRIGAGAGGGPDGAGADGEAARPEPREQQVIELLADGRSNKEIASRLGLSESTVKGYVASILQKLNVPSRAGAAAWWAAGHGADPSTQPEPNGGG